MKNRLVFLLFIILFESDVLFAAQKTVSFFVGKVYIAQVKGKKTPVSVNMNIPDSATIITGKNSYVVIQSGEATYTIKENTKVQVNELARYKPGNDETYAVIRKLYEKIRTEKTTVTAVRADRKITDPQPVFTEGEDEPLVNADDESKVYASMSEAVAQKNYPKALSQYESYIKKVKPSSARVDYLAALSQFYLGRYSESANMFTLISGRKSDDALAASSLFYAAFSYQSLLDFSRSNDFFGKYLSVEPRGDFAPYAFYLMGVNYLRLNDSKNAEEQFRTVVERFPSDPIATDAKLMINK